MTKSKNNDEHFYFAPFGGTPDGEGDGIGANCSIAAYTDGNKTTRIMMDFGVKLPTDEMKVKFPGTNGVIPDYTLFFDTKESKAKYPVDAIFLTHAHADHIDGLTSAFISAKQSGAKIPPIYGSRNTLLTLKDNLKEKNINFTNYEFNEIKPYKEIKINGVSVHPIPVSHTTAESYGFLWHKKGKNGIFNSGDHRSLGAYSSFGGSNEIFAKLLHKIEMTGMLMDSTSTGIKRDPKTEITLQTALDSLQQIFDENKGKQIFTPVISRATENWLPFLITAKENNKKIFFDGYHLRKAFARWQDLNSFYYVDSKGQLVECKEQNKKKKKEKMEKLREKGVKMYVAEDFRDTVYGYDDVIHTKPEDYIAEVSEGNQLVIMSGAFAERSDTKRSGAVKMAEGDHEFHLSKRAVVIHSQRAIKGLNHEGVIELVNMEARQGAKIYANSFGVYLGDFVTYMPLQASGHDNAEDAYELMKFVMENAKNTKSFNKDNPFYVLGIHGGKDYRETTANIALKDERMKGFVPSNYGIYEYKTGSVKEIKNTSLENQRYFVVINVPMSGQWILLPVNGFYEKNGEEEKVFAIESLTGNVKRSHSEVIRDRALKAEELQEHRQSNKEAKAQKNRQTFKAKHISKRKAKKENKKWEEKEVNKNKQNKQNARKFREYTDR